MKFGIKALALATLVACQAAPAAQAQTKWTGFSVGAGLGAGAIVHDLNITSVPPGAFALGFDGIGGEGIFGTVGVAADIQIAPRFVVGVFFDYDFADLETEADLSAFGFTASANVKLENQWTIGGRAGILTSPDTLVYGLIGYTQADTSDLTASFVGGSISLGVPSFSGVTFGGGIETMLAPNWSLKAEYRFTQLDGESLDLPFGFGNFVDVELEPSIHSARVSVNYKFDWNRARHVEPLK